MEQSKLIFDIQKEKQLINLLGYSIVGPDCNNRWIIRDENEKPVGYIQYKKLRVNVLEDSVEKIYGYEVQIDSPKFYTKYKSLVHNDKGEIIDTPSDSYSFEIRKKGNDIGYVELNYGEFPSLQIWHEKKGFLSFHVDYEGLYLNYKSKTKNFNIEETVVFKNSEDEYQRAKEYFYQIRSAKKGTPITENTSSKGITTREISGVKEFPYEIQPLVIKEKKWVNGKLKKNTQCKVEGTVEEMARKQEMGIDSFKRFQAMIKKLLPFKEDIIPIMIPQKMVEAYNLQAFFPSEEKKREEKSKYETK